MTRVLLFVGIGGFIGSIARILCQQYAQRFLPFDFPTGTIAVNVLGSFAIGLIYGLADQRSFFTPEIKLFLTAGLCGGFTTFSSFTYESLNLLRSGQISMALIYIIASNTIGLAAVIAGYYAGK
jgi:CrcB protein